jgi:three-Cys-motif partner protein
VRYVFIEKVPRRAACLEGIIDSLALPENFKPTVCGGVTFEEAYNQVVKGLIAGKARTIPTFAFIDPFGWSGVPFEIVADILGRPSCEVLLTFMYEEMNRFLGHPDQEENFDRYFGTREWRSVVGIADARERNRALHDLYLRQLRNLAHAKFVRSFEMRNRLDVTDYFLFFATNNPLGLKRMKESMWKVDETGEFKFSDATDPSQLTFFIQEPDFSSLEQLIVRRFAGRTVTVEEIERFVLEETPFLQTHYKRQVLGPLERGQPRRITVLPNDPKRRPGTFADPRLRIRFELPA